MEKRCTYLPNILMPRKGTDLYRWAVIACDQYTSQPEYWEKADEIVGEAPSTLRLTLPEVYLESPDVDKRITDICNTMDSYLTDGTLAPLAPGMVLLSRETGGSHPHRGLMMSFDLEAYDYSPESQSLIRPTERTVVSRIPPRLRVREYASVEVPHIMLMMDDPERTVIEPLFHKLDSFEKLYDTDLMQGGGHLTGWFIPAGAETDAIQKALDGLYDREKFNRKYGLSGNSNAIFPFAVGDGNHSMATAKAHWEQVKQGLTPEEQQQHPARYVLAELTNIHDESIEIKAINRVLFGVEPKELFDFAGDFFAARNGSAKLSPAPADDGSQCFPLTYGDGNGYLLIENSPWALPVATLQNMLDSFLETHPTVTIDYVHGDDVTGELAAHNGNMGFFLPDPAKGDLFRGVILDGVLPRKTFSMGHAHEKRFYMECKKITL